MGTAVSHLTGDGVALADKMVSLHLKPVLITGLHFNLCCRTLSDAHEVHLGAVRWEDLAEALYVLLCAHF